jgi:hypothetical protein
VIGTDNVAFPGGQSGTEFVTFTTAQLPAHLHSTPDIVPTVPKPASIALFATGLLGIVLRTRFTAQPRLP